MRDRKDFLQHRDYIHDNPVRARLCSRPEDYPFSSAFIQPTSMAEATLPPLDTVWQNP